MADVLNKTIKMITVDISGLQITNGLWPYYGEVTPSFPSDFHFVIGYCYIGGWDERVRVYVRRTGIGFACDTAITLPDNRKMNVFYI